MMDDIRGCRVSDVGFQTGQNPTSFDPLSTRSPSDSIFAFDEDLNNQFQLNVIENKAMHTLSGGTKQKVGAALAFRYDPSVIILDEPTAGLDPLASEILKDKIKYEHEKGKLILITSHVLSDLDDLATHVLYLQEGQIQFFKPLETLQDETGERKLGRILAHIMKKDKKKPPCQKSSNTSSTTSSEARW